MSYTKKNLKETISRAEKLNQVLGVTVLKNLFHKLSTSSNKVVAYANAFLTGDTTDEHALWNVNHAYKLLRDATVDLRNEIGKQVSRCRSINSSSIRLNKQASTRTAEGEVVDMTVNIVMEIQDYITNRTPAATEFSASSEGGISRIFMKYRGYTVKVLPGLERVPSDERMVYSSLSDGSYVVFYTKINDIKSVLDHIDMLVSQREQFPETSQRRVRQTIPVPNTTNHKVMAVGVAPMFIKIKNGGKTNAKSSR